MLDNCGCNTRLRQGMKWSDGAPFTAADIMFACEGMMNEACTPFAPDTTNPLTVEKVDDTTVKLVFERPADLFIQSQADHWGGIWWTSTPRHYLEQFHINFNENADQEAKQTGFPS